MNLFLNRSVKSSRMQDNQQRYGGNRFFLCECREMTPYLTPSSLLLTRILLPPPQVSSFSCTPSQWRRHDQVFSRFKKKLVKQLGELQFMDMKVLCCLMRLVFNSSHM
eukprot:TRINITY_DN1788_c0_g1_i4.p2 TRINITY_DN1788_c0_g1~~TRINITY_DN1788_c0_g1_i4.p2  ORF type:complete len:108 (+),score=2.97 TRINITY_DN1788_c0_g1_i4:162-485(+)